MSSKREQINQRIEDMLIDALEKDLSPEQVDRMERKLGMIQRLNNKNIDKK